MQKKFLIKLIGFLSPIILVVIIIEYSLSKIPNSYNKKKAYLEHQLDSIQILVTGNSHSVFGINPSFFSPKGFNVSNISQNLFYDKELTLKYLSKLKDLRVVIIPVSYASLFVEPLENTEEDWRCYYYKKYWDISSRNLSPFNLSNFSYISLYTWKESKKFLWQKFKLDLASNLETNGFMVYDTANSNLINDSLGYKRLIAHERQMGNQYLTENYKSLNALVKQLKESRIAVVLITPPVFSTYYKYCNPVFLRQNEIVLARLCKQYGIRYFNYLKDQRFEKSDFKDNDHLNYLGAAHFSQILNKEVLANHN